jgi:transposase InsO family protein
MVPVRWLCDWTGTSSSTWYYSPGEGRRGVKPSTHTILTSGDKVPNDKVVEEIKEVLSEEFICYGYEKVTWELHDRGYVINKKKVYRLMDEAHLLHRHNRVATQGRRQFVQTRRIEADYPLQYLVMDIKFVWIQGERRNVYLLTIMDVFSRKVLAHTCKPSIKQTDVVLLLDGIVQKYQTKGVIIRNDNGSQFLAHSVRKYLKSKEINQEFTHVATPEENAYIEALHSVLEKELIRRYWFDSIHYARWKIEGYYKTYNSKRKHRSLRRKSPDQVWNNYYEPLKTNEKLLFNHQTLLN